MRQHSTNFRGFRLITRFVHAYLFLILACTSIPIITPTCSAQIAQTSVSTAVDDAHRFLVTEKRGREALSYIHFGADYHGHQYLETDAVLDANGRTVPGNFALVYRYKWQDDGITDVAYLCDADGYIYKVQIMYTNAVLSPPFLLANATIKLLGNALIEANKDHMSEFERRIVQKLVDEADAKGLLEWSFKFEQRIGR